MKIGKEREGDEADDCFFAVAVFELMGRNELQRSRRALQVPNVGLQILDQWDCRLVNLMEFHNLANNRPDIGVGMQLVEVRSFGRMRYAKKMTQSAGARFTWGSRQQMASSSPSGPWHSFPPLHALYLANQPSRLLHSHARSMPYSYRGFPSAWGRLVACLQTPYLSVAPALRRRIHLSAYPIGLPACR